MGNDEAALRAEADGAARAAVDAPPVRVLLVDDKAENLLALETVLKDLGHHFVSARSGPEALKRVLDDDFAAIILDVRMPGMDGFETASLIRERERSRSTPIIFMTAVSKGETFVDKAYSVGAVDYIFKPFAPEILRAKVSVFVELYRKTEQIKAQAERLRLIESREHRRELSRMRAQRNRFFSLSLDLMCVVGFDGSIKECNESWEPALGYSREELIGENLEELLHPEDRAAATAHARQLRAAAGGALSWENRVRRGDGTYRWLLWSAAAYPREKEYYATARDITERREMEEKVRLLNADLEKRVRERTSELEAANQELEAFSYSVSHDLRAPLRKMDGFSDILVHRYGAVLNEEGRRLVEVIRANGQRMSQLIDDLLSFSRLGRKELARSSVDMESLARSILDDLLCQEQGRRVEARCAALPRAHGDPAMLRQLLFNLLSNAVKFTRRAADARVEIGFRDEAAETVYFVKDNGAGFDMKHSEKLFGVFQRLHTSAEFEGTGIGLALVKRIVKRHGGRVWADAAIGTGATFFFSLPKVTG